jgi:hypothetical protein
MLLKLLDTTLLPATNGSRRMFFLEGALESEETAKVFHVSKIKRG